MEPVIQGITLMLDPFNILLIFGGVLIGVTVGALPGLSSPMAVALLLPFSITLEPVPAIAMMAALYCAGTFGGSITAILINAPGAPPAAATALDGYPMAKRGEAGRALGLAAVSSVIGGLFSLLILHLTPEVGLDDVGVVRDLFVGAVSNGLPVVEDYYSVRDVTHHTHVVFDDDDGETPFTSQTADQGSQLG